MQHLFFFFFFFKLSLNKLAVHEPAYRRDNPAILLSVSRIPEVIANRRM